MKPESKFNMLKNVIAISALCIAAIVETTYAQNADAAEKAAEKQTTQIVFIPRGMGENAANHQKFKENTFYFWNFSDNPSKGPTVESEGGTQFLRIKGNDPQNGDKNQSYLDVTRVFHAPENATKATLSIKLRWTHDVWEELGPLPNYSHMTYFLGSGEKQIKATPIGKLIENSGIFLKENEGKWIEKSVPIEYAKGTKFVRIWIGVESSTTLDVAGMAMVFN